MAATATRTALPPKSGLAKSATSSVATWRSHRRRPRRHARPRDPDGPPGRGPCARRPRSSPTPPTPLLDAIDRGRSRTALFRPAAQAPSTAPVLGVGVAVPGNVDPATSSTRYLPNFGWLEPVGRRRDPRPARRRAPRCASGSASTACTCGTTGTARRSPSATLASAPAASTRPRDAHAVGTGIGGALIHDLTPARKGALFDGCSFDAGDFGHHVLRVGRDAFACVCGNHAAPAARRRRASCGSWRAKGGDAAPSLDCAKDGRAAAAAARPLAASVPMTSTSPPASPTSTIVQPERSSCGERSLRSCRRGRRPGLSGGPSMARRCPRRVARWRSPERGLFRLRRDGRRARGVGARQRHR